MSGHFESALASADTKWRNGDSKGCVLDYKKALKIAVEAKNDEKAGMVLMGLGFTLLQAKEIQPKREGIEYLRQAHHLAKQGGEAAQVVFVANIIQKAERDLQLYEENRTASKSRSDLKKGTVSGSGSGSGSESDLKSRPSVPSKTLEDLNSAHSGDGTERKGGGGGEERDSKDNERGKIKEGGLKANNNGNQAVWIACAKGLVVRSKVMLFLKGSPDAPYCSHSRDAVRVLDSLGLKFDTYDVITAHPEVCQALKQQANWPFFPQLYINGVLMGGADILKAYAEDNVLKQELISRGVDTNSFGEPISRCTAKSEPPPCATDHVKDLGTERKGEENGEIAVSRAESEVSSRIRRHGEGWGMSYMYWNVS
ncbi:hypothetical protein AAMO2058_000941900 [Amorphochlora amoebiformis]